MKFAIKLLIVCLILASNLSFAGVALRFQSMIDSKASHLGDVLFIQNDDHHWSTLPLQSHPTPGQWMTKDSIIAWMNQKLGTFEWQWQGKTKIQVKQSIQTSSDALLNKAKVALINQLESQYSRIELKALSAPKDSPYELNRFKTSIKNSYPSAKRVCVWLNYEKKRIPVWFEVHTYAQVLVAKENLSSNTAIKDTNFSLQERNIAGLKSQPAKILAKNPWLKSSISQGKILLANQLQETPLVTKGQSVKISVHQNNITVVMDAISLGDGSLGQTINVKNPINQQSFVAQITGSQQAEIRS